MSHNEQVRGRAVDNIEMRHNARKSLNYAKARYAIHEDADEIARSNVARAKNWVPVMKRHVIEFLGGECVNKGGKKIVVFPDGTEAKY